METIAGAWHMLLLLLVSPFQHGLWQFIWKFIPYVLFFEIPIYLFILLGILRYYLYRQQEVPLRLPYYPKVSCIVLGYNEGEQIKLSILTLAEQIYPGHIEILAMIDGAHQNPHTYKAALALVPRVRAIGNRSLKVIAKWQRGGRVSSLNAGLNMATGEIVMNIDGDTSFDNTMVRAAVAHFHDPQVVGVAGNLRVRNVTASLVTRLQAIEYNISIHATKIGLSEFNVVNNISGAFGIYRRQFVKKIGGWDSGTAEDLDLTIRTKNYFGRDSKMKILFEPRAIGHTDVPESLQGLLAQRLRWDGDLFYIYIRKHALSFDPKILGWRNLILMIWTGLFFQLVLPMVIILYSVLIFTFYPLQVVLAVWALVYLLYMAILLVLYTAFITLISERKKEDLKLAVLLPLMPFFTFLLRVWSGIATLKEMSMRAHLDSSMAPWWVLKKTKF